MTERAAPPVDRAPLAPFTPLPLRPETLVTGRIFDVLPAPAPVADPPALNLATTPTDSPLTVLEAAVRTALRRPPCAVSFSGGMDSTLVLAVALRVARREGLPPPIPVSWRFPTVPRADESSLQDDLLDQLGVSDRLPWPVTDELDMIGPVASRLLSRHGPVFPANMHLHLPIMESFRGGSVLTGWGGDQTLGAWSRRRWPDPRAVLHSGWTALPPPARRRIPRRGRTRAADYPWLTAEAAMTVARLARSEPSNGWGRPDRRIGWQQRCSGDRECSYNLAAVGTAQDVLMVSPLYEPAFVGALMAALPLHRRMTRGAVIAAISGGELPAVLSAPRPKAWFGKVLRQRPSADFVRSWDGSGIPSQDVDTAALQRLWASGDIPPGTEFLVQQAWTHELRRRG